MAARVPATRLPWALVVLVLAALVALAGCSSGDPVERHGRAKAGTAAGADDGAAAAAPPAARAKPDDLVSAVSAGKPGAPVDIKFDIAQQPKLGEPLDIRVEILPRSADIDQLRVVFQSSESIEVRAGGEWLLSDRPADGSSYAHTVTVVPQRNGVYYLSAVALVDGKAGSVARSFAIPIIVGDAVALTEAASKPSQGTAGTDASGNRVVSLPASEKP
ncbi:MAG: hypothetical protein U1F11_06985 [Steroidobacteraceae bacterium]